MSIHYLNYAGIHITIQVAFAIYYLIYAVKCDFLQIAPSLPVRIYLYHSLLSPILFCFSVFNPQWMEKPENRLVRALMEGEVSSRESASSCTALEFKFLHTFGLLKQDIAGSHLCVAGAEFSGLRLLGV